LFVSIILIGKFPNSLRILSVNRLVMGRRSVSLGAGSCARVLTKIQIDVVDWISRGALEAIGKSGFGYSFDSLDEPGQSHPYATAVKLIA
jgi:hypothetical protein